MAAGVNKNKLLDNATKYIQKGQVDRAIKELQKVIEADPADVRTRLKLGDLFAKKNQNAEAAEQYNLVAESYSKDGFYLKAVAVYKQILKLDSSLIDVHLKLGELYHQLGLLSDAMGQYQIVAQHYDSKGMSKESLATLRKMVELDPENIQSRKKLAEIIAREGQTAEAIEEFQKIAEDLKSKGRLDDLAGVLERVVHLDATNLGTVRELAALYLDRGDPKRALAKLQLCFRANPHDLGTLEMLSKAFVSLGQPEKAKSVYREIAKIHDTAGNASARMEAFRAIVQIDPNDAEALAVVEGRPVPENSVESSMPSLDDVAAPAPAPVATPAASRASSAHAPAPAAMSGADDPQTISKLLTEADVYLKYGLLEKALDHLRGIVRRNPGNVDAHLKLKDVYLQHKDVEGAVAEIISVIDLCEQSGDSARAAEALQEGLRFAPGHASLEARRSISGAAPAAAAGAFGGAQQDPGDGVEISIDGGDQSDSMLDDGQKNSDVEISIDGGDDQIQLPEDAGVEIQVENPQAEVEVEFDAEPAIEVEAPNDVIQGLTGDVDVSVVDDIAIDPGRFDDTALDDVVKPSGSQAPARAARGADVVSLDARRGDGRSPAEGASAISPDQLLDELATAFGSGGNSDEIRIDDGDGDSGSDIPISMESDVESMPEVDGDPVIETRDPISFDRSRSDSARASGGRSIEDRFGANDAAGADSEAEAFSEDVAIEPQDDFAVGSGITDMSVDLSGDEISGEAVPDEASLALETDDAIAVDESPAPTRSSAPVPAAAPRTPSMAAAVAAATALNADPIPPEFADDVDEADFFVKQEIYDEAISVYKRLLKKAPSNGALLERMSRAQALLNGESPISAAPAAAPAAKAVPAPVVAPPPRIEAKVVEAPKPAPKAEAPKPVPKAEPVVAKPEPVAAKPAAPVATAMPPKAEEPAEETGGFDLAAELMAELDEIAEEEEDAAPSFDDTEQVSVADVLREFRKGVDAQVGQEDKQARYDLGIAYREMGLWDEAIGEFQIASGDPARRADCFNMMGMCQRDKGELDGAIKSFTEAYKVASSDKQKAAFSYELGATLEAKGDPSSMTKSQQFYKQVQALDPGFRDVAQKLAGHGSTPNKKISYV